MLPLERVAAIANINREAERARIERERAAEQPPAADEPDESEPRLAWTITGTSPSLTFAADVAWQAA